MPIYTQNKSWKEVCKDVEHCFDMSGEDRHMFPPPPSLNIVKTFYSEKA